MFLQTTAGHNRGPPEQTHIHQLIIWLINFNICEKWGTKNKILKKQLENMLNTEHAGKLLKKTENMLNKTWHNSGPPQQFHWARIILENLTQ